MKTRHKEANDKKASHKNAHTPHMDSCVCMETFEMVQRQTKVEKSHTPPMANILCSVMSEKSSEVMNSQEHTYYNFIILMTFY